MTSNFFPQYVQNKMVISVTNYYFYLIDTNIQLNNTLDYS